MARQLTTIEARAVKAFRGVLPPTADIREGRSGSVSVNGNAVEVTWIGDGRLADARRLLGHTPMPESLVAAARHLSPGAREALSEAGVSWVDETGAAEISIGSIVVARTGRPPTPGASEPRWTPSVIATVEALLCDAAATVSSIKSVTGLSAGSCTNALRTLSDLGLLERDAERGPASGRRIADRSALLDAYTTAASAQPAPVELVVGVLWRDAVDGMKSVGDRWTAAGVEWSVTGAVASAALAPLLTSIESAVAYVDATTIIDLEVAASAAELQPIGGGRLTLRPFPTVTTKRLARRVDGLSVAPWPRVYVDLTQTGVRGEEGAEHLREVIDNDR